MNRKNLAILLAVMAVVVIGVMAAFGQAKPAKPAKPVAITVKGEVVDLWCYLDHGGRGAGHKDCAIACVKAGNPIGIVDAKGNVYIAMGSAKHEPGATNLLDKMADTVTVKGTLTKKGGLQAIYVETIE